MDGNFRSIRRIILSVLVLGLYGPLFSQEYLEIKAKAGDGITVLLDRYDLEGSDCNRDSFFLFNKLRPESYLILDRTYRLPIYLYAYNGVSIRSSIGNNDYDLALRIQQYNEQMLASGVREEDYRKDNVLWVPFHEFYCPVNVKETPLEKTGVNDPNLSDHKETGNSGEKILRYENFPILGSNHEKTAIYSENLKGQVYYLISGHGGPDPGAIGQSNEHTLCEDEYAYDVTLRLARNLLQHSATVYMITRDDSDGIRDDVYLDCDKDETVWPDQRIPLNHVRRLRQRTAKINELYDRHRAEGATVQRIIEIHIDSRYEDQKVDIFFYYFPGSTMGKSLADQMYATVKSKYEEHQKNRGYSGVVKSRDLYTLRESKPSAVYIELGNITNSFDQRRLLIVNNRQAIANWLSYGILNYK